MKTFIGEKSYFSNMYILPHGLDLGLGIIVPTTENPYQADKFVDEDLRMGVLFAIDGMTAKRMSARFTSEGAVIRSDWDDIKVGVMRSYVEMKFDQYPDLAAKLIATGAEYIEEGNSWGDTFWGVSPIGSGIGLNHLGKILMAKREELRGRSH